MSRRQALVSRAVCACTTKSGLAEAGDCLINRISLAVLGSGTDRCDQKMN